MRPDEVEKAFLFVIIMTLKEYLEENLITSTPKQRSDLGQLLVESNTSLTKKKEDGYMVRDYTLTFLMSEETINIIMSFFQSIEFEKLSKTF